MCVLKKRRFQVRTQFPDYCRQMKEAMKCVRNIWKLLLYTHEEGNVDWILFV